MMLKYTIVFVSLCFSCFVYSMISDIRELKQSKLAENYAYEFEEKMLCKEENFFRRAIEEEEYEQNNFIKKLQQDKESSSKVKVINQKQRAKQSFKLLNKRVNLSSL